MHLQYLITQKIYIYIIINFNVNLIFSDELTKATDKLQYKDFDNFKEIIFMYKHTSLYDLRTCYNGYE